MQAAQKNKQRKNRKKVSRYEIRGQERGGGDSVFNQNILEKYTCVCVREKREFAIYFREIGQLKKKRTYLS